MQAAGRGFGKQKHALDNMPSLEAKYALKWNQQKQTPSSPTPHYTI